MPQVDYIIVGQGLAGSALAIQAVWRNKKVLVVDKQEENTSSRLAAGLFNPFTGKRMAKTWLVNNVFPYLHEFYRKIEEETASKFLYAAPLYRPFASIAEQNEWMAGSVDDSVATFVEKVSTKPCYPESVHDTFGGFIVKGGGYLNTLLYIKVVQLWLQEKGCYQAQDFCDEELTIGENGVVYRDWQARYIVFCEGESVRMNKFFSWLPVLPLKGETITVRGKFLEDVLVNRGVYVVPSGKDEWKVGSTYDRDFKKRGITESGRTELETKLRELIKAPFTVTGQDAGIRPTTPDRRPILGKHPKHEPVVIFNGLGTKGVSLAPYFSEELIDLLEKGKLVNKEVDISRYKSLYWNSR